MYVITFYSFKGGVGRTMALANVACELAKRGRRVLLVDFDLEAPGLTDFELFESKRKTPGLVEFINDYMSDGKVPDIKDYVYPTTKYPDLSDRLWVMPAGCQNSDYQSAFCTINWQDLYDSHQGYLLMEDLRAQWQKTLQPDYVFIDSRTGYTDIAGICTRQLPDAVCLIFTPNKQNLTGLTKIATDIKAQSETPGLRHPRLHFVASNIPTVDDDDGILKRSLANFSRQLEYIEPAGVIHHYNSFALINEAVFTLEYPKHPLAIEYKSLADEIIKENFQDRLVVIDFLRRVVERSLHHESSFSEKEIDQKLADLSTHFGADPEVLYWLSRARRSMGNLEDSEMLLDAAIESGLSTPRGFLDRAIIKINHDERDEEAVWADLEKILSMDKVLPSELLWTIKLAIRLGHKNSKEFLTAPAIVDLSGEDLVHLADKLHDSPHTVGLAVELLSSAINGRDINKKTRVRALNILGMGAIALGQLEKAIGSLSFENFGDEQVGLDTVFNLAMAQYWVGDTVDSKIYFDQVVKTIKLEAAIDSANILQCLSFANYATGNLEKANELLQLASDKVTAHPVPTFSCWRYLETSPVNFKADLDEMKILYEGGSISPIFCKSR